MKAALLGYGTIGKGVEILAKQVPGLEIKNVFVLPEFENLPYFTNNGQQVVTDPEIDIVFECLSGTEPANTLITEALKAGKHVITSNKAVVSPNLSRYVKLAKENGGSIQVEAAVAGGIPFLDALLKFSLLEDLNGYEGIFNGTSNYILDKMQKEGTDYAAALAEAQKKGYAEYDPANDVEGWDVFYKANISNALAYKSYDPEIRNPLGISKLNTSDIKKAKSEDRIIRHIAKSVQKDGKFDTIVAPVFLNKEDYLANIPSNYNAQLIYAPSFDKIGYFGQGAGRFATAQAMLANAIDTLNDTEREIVLDKNLEYDPTLIREDWIVRSKADLSDMENIVNVETLDENEKYYFFKDRNSELIEQVQAKDPEAMIALWR
ncbi:homoserine dehydrogenase [Ileibacterium valens]|uniref:homoserine dehydrogenase n=1 Tax=Ileibacterium valens TaxID=1862668 RepID=UPI0024B9F335|nr:homoserine dehydrogenase [Ileibacterium valens]